MTASIFTTAASEQTTAGVVLNATEPDANGLFTVTLSVYNATFNAFQLAFSYNKEVISPADNTGEAVSGFNNCGKAGEQTLSWMVPVGNKLNIEQGLLECGGYVKPGSGSITADASGILLYTFTFRQTGEGNAGIKLATADSGGPFNPSISEGGGIADGGYNVDTIIEVKLPKTLGESVVDEIVTPISDTSTSNAENKDHRAVRLKNTVILQINNGTAVKEGVLTRIDDNNKFVTPYIDENNRTMVPVRFLAESLGAIVNWDDSKQQVRISFEGKEIIMTIGSKEYSINKISKIMDTVPVINEGWDRTMVPARFVAEALGMDVKWDQNNNLVIVSPLSIPWDMNGTVENEIITDTLLLMSPLMRDFN